MTVKQLWTQNTEYNAVDDRLAIAALLPSGAAGEYGTAVGVRGADDLVPILVANTSASVSRGIGAVELGGSVYLIGSDADEQVPIAPSDPTNGRIDRIVAQAFDAEAGGSDQPPVIIVVPGEAAPSPVAPTLEDGQLHLADVTVPAGTGVPTLTDRRTFVQAGRPIAALGADSPINLGSNVWTGITAYQQTRIPVRGFNYAAGIFTALRAGAYRWHGTALYGLSTSGDIAVQHLRGVTIYVNGATVPSYAGRQDQVVHFPAKASFVLSGSGLIWLNVGDRVQLVVYQSSGKVLPTRVGVSLMMEDAGSGRDADTRVAAVNEWDWGDEPGWNGDRFEQSDQGEDLVAVEGQGA